MLVPVTTLLARAHRHKTGTISFLVSNFEILTTVLEQAVDQDKSVIIILNAAEILTVPIELLIKCALYMAEQLPIQIGISVCIQPEKEMLKTVLEAGAPAIQMAYSGEESRAQITRFTAEATLLAKPLHAEVLGTIYHFMTLPKVSDFILHTGIHALVLPVVVQSQGKPMVSLVHIKELQRLKIPLIAADLEEAPGWAPKCFQAGITSMQITHSLDEAYTAGLRTGLRNYAAVHPGKFQKHALDAVSKTANQFLQLIH